MATSKPKTPQTTATVTPEDASAPSPCRAPSREEFTLDNGLSISIEQTAPARAEVTLELPTGEFDAPIHLAHLVEHLFTDTISRGHAGIGEASLGANVGAHTDFWSTSYTVRGSPEDLLRFMWLIRRALDVIKYDQATIDAARRVVAKETTERFRAGASTLRFAVGAALSGTRVVDPLRVPVYSPRDVREFISSGYTLRGAHLELSSPYPPSEVRPFVVAMFSRPEPPSPHQRPHHDLPTGTVRVCMDGLPEGSMVLTLADPNPSTPPTEAHALARTLSRGSATPLVDSSSGHPHFKRVGVGYDDKLTGVDRWTVTMTFRGDLDWDHLAAATEEIFPSLWHAPGEAVAATAAERWFAGAVTARCEPAAPRPDFHAIERSVRVPIPKIRTILLVRNAVECSSSD